MTCKSGLVKPGSLTTYRAAVGIMGPSPPIYRSNTITSASTTCRLSELTNRSSLTCLCRSLAAGQPQKSPSDFACCLANIVLVFQELLQYWKTTYDWRKQEQILNKTLHHFTIPLNAIDLHFVHEKSKHRNAIPLLITHGWPGSFLEFTEIIPELVNPGDNSMQTSSVLFLLCFWAKIAPASLFACPSPTPAKPVP